MEINQDGILKQAFKFPFFSGSNFYFSDIAKISNNRTLVLFYRNNNYYDSTISCAIIADTMGATLNYKEYGGTVYTFLNRVLLPEPGKIMFVGTSDYLFNYWENVVAIKTDSSLYAPPISVKNITQLVPDKLYLNQNYPNPFNNSTQITFGIIKKGIYKLTVYDVTGRLVDELFNQNLEPGEYKTDFNAEKLSSGIYFYRLESDKAIITKKFVLLK